MTSAPRWTKFVLVFFITAVVLYAQEEKAFDGLNLNLAPPVSSAGAGRSRPV
jgi:hypothetical protein